MTQADKTNFLKRLLRRLAWLSGGLLLLIVLAGALAAWMVRSSKVPESLKAPPPGLLTASSDAARANARRPAAAPDRPRWDRPEVPEGFEAYIRFHRDRNPNDPAAALYLEIIEPFENGLSTEFDTLFRSPDHPNRRWNPGDPLTDEQIHWLEEHQEYLDRLLAMIVAGGPPVMSREEIAAFDDAERTKMPVPNFLFYRLSGQMLAAEAQRLLELGDFAGAADRIAPIFPWADSVGDQVLIGHLVDIAVQGLGYDAIRYWIEQGHPMTPEIAARFGRAMAENVAPIRDHRFNLEMEYRASRAITVSVRELPFFALVINLNDSWNWDPTKALPPPSIYDIVGTAAGDPESFVANTWTAFRVKTGDVRAQLERFDRFHQTYLDSIAIPFSELSDPESLIGDFPHDDLGTMFLPSYSEYFKRAAESETRSHLNRASLDLLGGGSPPATFDTAGDAWLDSPWRDPFTEEPLRIVEDGQTGETSIYSLGPDGEDQGGGIHYDPTNGSISAGDLVIRVPRR
jgi:hypothetical protein